MGVSLGQKETRVLIHDDVTTSKRFAKLNGTDLPDEGFVRIMPISTT